MADGRLFPAHIAWLAQNLELRPKPNAVGSNQGLATGVICTWIMRPSISKFVTSKPNMSLGKTAGRKRPALQIICQLSLQYPRHHPPQCPST